MNDKVTEKTILKTGILLGLLAVVFGAFGAHGLKKLVTSEGVAAFETGVRYQMYHALLLLLIANMPLIPLKAKQWSFWCLVFGLLFFSGSIYLLSLNEFLPFNFKPFGFVTPIGGILLILSWILLFFGIFQKKPK